jgi:hypothetical protein
MDLEHLVIFKPIRWSVKFCDKIFVENVLKKFIKTAILNTVESFYDKIINQWVITENRLSIVADSEKCTIHIKYAFS